MSRYRTKAMIKAEADANPTPPIVCGCDEIGFALGWRSAGCKLHGLALPDRANKRTTDPNQDCAIYWGQNE